MQSAVSHALRHPPLDNELLQNSQFVDIRRVEAGFTQVAYLVQNFSELLPYSDVRAAVCTVCRVPNYANTSIPAHVSNDAKVRENFMINAVLWSTSCSYAVS